MTAPANKPATVTLEDMIMSMVQDCVNSAAAYDSLPIEAAQKLFADVRKLMTENNWPAVYQHNFFVTVKNTLKARTYGHPTTLQIIRLLEIETEFN
jgi:hypothetical protein